MPSRLSHRVDVWGHCARELVARRYGRGSLVSWQALVQACIADIELRICKEGSRVHAINDLRLRVARFRDPADSQRLLSWAMEVNPLTHLKRFNRRIETIFQIHRSGLMDLTAVLQQLRGMRPKGAAEKIRKASSMRVRVIPSDADLEHWLDRLEPFHQWVFACIPCSGFGPTSSGTPKVWTSGAGSPFPAT